MKRTTVKLPDDLDYQLRYEAARRQTTVSALTQQAIEAFLGVGQRRKLLSGGAGDSGRDDISERIESFLGTGTRRKLGAAGAGRSGQGDIAERMEELLREELRP